MARTVHHEPYDVQMRAAWGDTEPTPYIDPLTGDEWEPTFWKNPRRDRIARGVGTIEPLPGAHIGGSNPSAHREFLGRPRHIPTAADFDYDEAAEAAYDAEQRSLDELSRDLHSEALDDEDWYEYEPQYAWELDYYDD